MSIPSMTAFQEKVRATRIKLARVSVDLAEKYADRRPGAEATPTIRALVAATKNLIDELERPPTTAKETP
jgi:hypothetical protein